ncbi:hypothetical protein HMPREF1548_02168 [Clostridium sp. KLE 1755]|nr:hypothetical protein HMPREF1548_02168 [Clostridium sp. KLE 1755]
MNTGWKYWGERMRLFHVCTLMRIRREQPFFIYVRGVKNE